MRFPRKQNPACGRQASLRPASVNYESAYCGLLCCGGHDQFFYYWDWQGAFVQDEIVEFLQVEVFSGCGLIFLAQREPFAYADVVGGQLRGTQLDAL